MQLASDSFRDRSAMPAPHSPQLRWSGVPAGVSSLALLCMDADAPPGGPDIFHWSVVDIPPSMAGLDEAASLPLRQGQNDFGQVGYHAPLPPPQQTRHYIFRLYALDVARLALPSPFTGADVLQAIYGHIVDEAQLIGTYTRT